MPPERARAGAANGKSENAFRTISEVSAELDLPQHVLRFWETRFSQIKPMKRNGGRRLYRPDHIALLRGIKALLYEDGMTIKGVQKILREQGPKAVAARGREDAGTQVGPGGVPADVTERLSALRERLEERMAAAGESESGEGAATEPEAAEPDRRDPADRPRTDTALDDADIARMRDSIARLEALLTQLERD